MKIYVKMGYSLEEVEQALQENNLSYEINIENKRESRGRGRPKSHSHSSDEVEIEVVRVEVGNECYLKTREGVLLDSKSYEIIGIMNGEEIERIK